jgi:hypothetical protein
LLRYYGNPERLRCLNTFGGNAGIVNCKRPHGKLLYYDPLELNMKRPTFVLFLFSVLCGRKPNAVMFTVFLWVESKCRDVYSVSVGGSQMLWCLQCFCGWKPNAVMLTVFLWVEAKPCDVYSVSVGGSQMLWCLQWFCGWKPNAVMLQCFCGWKPNAVMFTVFLWLEAKCCDVYSVYSGAACFRKVPPHKAERLLLVPSQLSTRVTQQCSRGTSWIRKSK